MNVVPILGRGPNDRAIKIVEDFLQRLKRGEIVNVAIVGEQRLDGEIFATYDVAPGNGEPIKLRGGLALVGTLIDRKIMGEK